MNIFNKQTSAYDNIVRLNVRCAIQAQMQPFWDRHHGKCGSKVRHCAGLGVFKSVKTWHKIIQSEAISALKL